MNMFKFGKNNKDLVAYLLIYLVETRYAGLCDWLDYIEPDSVWTWFGCQEPFTEEGGDSFPVEFALYPGWNDLNYIYRSTKNKIDVSLPQGQLRKWWCYNLAIAVSQHPEFE